MTPNDFTTATTAWIAAVVSIAAIAIPAYIKIKGMIDGLNAKHEQNAGRITQHDNLAGIVTTQSATMNQPLQGTGPVNPAPIGPLPDPQAFRQPLGQPQKPSA